MCQEGQRSSPGLLFKRLLSREEEGSYRHPDLHLSSQHCTEKVCVLPAYRPTPAAGGRADRPIRITAGRVATLGPHHSLSRSQEHSWVPRKPEAILVNAPCVSKRSVPRTPVGLASCSVCRMGHFHATQITCKISLVSWWQGMPPCFPALWVLIHGSYQLFSQLNPGLSENQTREPGDCSKARTTTPTCPLGLQHHIRASGLQFKDELQACSPETWIPLTS